MSTEALPAADGAGSHLGGPQTTVTGWEHSGSRRWRLNRGGIVNIWQYADRTFDLDGGRAVFQGTNGSGKSRTLELLLPLCLDGDLRQIGSKGFDTVSIRRLMLDEYQGGPNRVGYAWIELCRDLPGGDTHPQAPPEQEFLTCGVGVKASRTSQQVSDSWRFVTSRRVGVDLNLIGQGDVPLGPTQLREALGPDCVLDEQAFRARIAATVYGVPVARYGDLLHLQRTLRNPDVGLKVLEGQLEQILSDALPPLDAGLIERLATSFEDLESIRENIVRLTGADGALREFLTTYSGYALGSLRHRATSMRDAGEKLRSLRRELTDLEERLHAERTEQQAAEQEVDELQRRDGELESTLEALRSRPAYTELQNLRDRRALVDRVRSAAGAALDTAARHRAQEQRSVESVLGLLRRLSGDVDSVRRTTDHAGRRLAATGLDGSLVPELPTVPTAEATNSSDRVRAAPEPDAEPLDVDRTAPPHVDTDALAASLHDAVTRSEHADTVARQRGALTLALHQQAVELDGERATVTETQRLAREARLRATDAAGRRNQAQQELEATASTWIEQLRTWARSWPLPAAADDVPEPPAAEELAADRTASRRAREQARNLTRPHVEGARRRVAEAEQELAALRSAVRTLESELAELREGGEPAPSRPGWAEAERMAADGAAFHRLVDFADSLPESDRAGLEAALEAAGVLDAWVTAEGRCPGMAELLAAPDRRPSGPTLDELLVAAPEPDCPVTSDRVTALLASVPLVPAGSEPAAESGLSVSVDGSWQAGVLRGTWHKDTAEHVGAGAREAARARRMAELEAELSRLRADSAESEQRHREATDRAAEAERHLDSYPADDDLITAHARLDSALETAREAENEAARLRREHEQAEARWRAAHTELVRSAGEADLTPETEALDAAHRAATEARDAVRAAAESIRTRCLTTLSDLHEATLHHDAAVADRMAAESQAEQHCTDFGEQAAALAELSAAVGDEGREISDQVDSLERERAQVREQLPESRRKAGRLRDAGVKSEVQLDEKGKLLDDRKANAEAATESFRQALRVPGLWAAAGVGGESALSPPDDPEEAADLVHGESDRSVSTDKDVSNELPRLQQSLSASYDIASGEQHGLWTVTVTGEEGSQPVAEAARYVGERLGEQRGYLDERYRSIFADYLIRDLAEHLRSQINVAEDLCRRMNEVLDGARSSQGVHVQLDWQPSAALSDDVRQAIELVRTPFANRSEEQDALLRRVFTDLIESERDSASEGYAEVLARALDYRSWYTFTVRVRDTDPEGRQRVRRLRQLSSGETRLVSYVTLFAAAAAFYDAIGASTAGRGPLRLVLLDEAFERLDDPTVARMLGLLVDLDMDWVITWPSGWGVSPKIPKMHIYDVLRPHSGHGIACTHTTWDGRGLERTEH